MAALLLRQPKYLCLDFAPSIVHHHSLEVASPSQRRDPQHQNTHPPLHCHLLSLARPPPQPLIPILAKRVSLPSREPPLLDLESICTLRKPPSSTRSTAAQNASPAVPGLLLARICWHLDIGATPFESRSLPELVQSKGIQRLSKATEATHCPHIFCHLINAFLLHPPVNARLRAPRDATSPLPLPPFISPRLR